jgi:hypothetical protein
MASPLSLDLVSRQVEGLHDRCGRRDFSLGRPLVGVKLPRREFRAQSHFDPNVWSGRASQEVFVDLSALRSCINVPGLCLERRYAPGHHGCQRDRSNYWITSSAVASSVSGMVRPSALAVLRLSTNANLLGCCTGKSPGFSPRRIRSI